MANRFDNPSKQPKPIPKASNGSAIAALDKFEGAGKIKAREQKEQCLASYKKGYQEELATIPEDIAAIEEELFGDEGIAVFFGFTPLLLDGSQSNGDSDINQASGSTIDIPAITAEVSA
jgi:hypothetical protein